MAGNEVGGKDDRPEWVRAHDALSKLAKQRAAADAEEGRWLLAALRAAVHVHLGYGQFAEYVERLFGYRPRSTREKLRVAEALEELPQTSTALNEGRISWSAVRELTRVATPENEGQWLDVARGKTARQLEALTAGKVPGDGPDAPNREDLRRHVLRFEVSAETLACVREAIQKLRRDAVLELDDDSALLLMARHVLGGPTDDGRSSYQVALTVCHECGRGQQQAAGELVQVGPEVVEMAECDAQHIGCVDAAHVSQASAVPARATQTIPPAIRRAVLRRDHRRCVVPGCRNSVFLDLHHLKLRCEGGTHDPDLLVTLCCAHHRCQHRGELIIEGTVSSGLTFRHADGTPYGEPADPRAVDAGSKVFQGLVGMGFRESDARRAIAEARSQISHAGDIKALLRASLQLLCERRERSTA